MSDDPRTLAEPELGIMPDDEHWGQGPNAATDQTMVEPETGVEPDPETATQRAETWAPKAGGDTAPATP